MMYKLMVTVISVMPLFAFTTVAFADWEKTFGSYYYEEGYQTVQTSEGGYIVVGSTTESTAGLSDIWLIKTDASGNKIWDKKFGGTGVAAFGLRVAQTSDNGYVVAGTISPTYSGSSDVWVIKTDALGNKIWDKTYGGIADTTDYPTWVKQTSDGGYIVERVSIASGKTSAFSVWLMKLNSSGDITWIQKFNDILMIGVGFGGSTTSDGGYILTGRAWVEAELWLTKTDASGNTIWSKTFSFEGGWLSGCSVVQSSDGGYIIVGCLSSYADGVGNNDIGLVKTDASGNKVWYKRFGTLGKDDRGISIVEAPGGGYVIVGYTNSCGAGGYDAWVLKTDASGNLTGTKTFGGSDDDEVFSIAKTQDGGYILAGYTCSFDVACGDVWLIKTTAPVGIEEKDYTVRVAGLNLSVNPNPVGISAEIRFLCPEGTKAILNLYDITGREVMQLFNGNVSGSKSIKWDITGITRGVYFVSLETDKGSYVEKIIILKHL